MISTKLKPNNRNPFADIIEASDSSATHYNDVIMGAMASQITSLTIVYSAVFSDADQRKHQSAASLAFVRGIHRGPVNSPHKGPVTRKMFPFDGVIMLWLFCWQSICNIYVFNHDFRHAISNSLLSIKIWSTVSSETSLLSVYCTSKIILRGIKKYARPYSTGVFFTLSNYRQTSDTRRGLVSKKLIEHLWCSWSIACRRCSNYIFILDLTPVFNGLGKDNCNMRQELFKFWYLVY